MIKIDLFETPKEFGNTEQLNKNKRRIIWIRDCTFRGKYNRDTIEHVLEEAFDIMQATFTFIRMNVKIKRNKSNKYNAYRKMEKDIKRLLNEN